MKTNFILFDCMETLVDLHDWKGLDEFALLAFKGSGAERCWANFDEFFRDYQKQKEMCDRLFPNNREYNISERFKCLVNDKFQEASDELKSELVEKLTVSFWTNYKSRCYVREDVKNVLPRLTESYQLGIVSNFKVPGGIEELLKLNGIERYFNFVTVSINMGWRKPHEAIYHHALNFMDALPEDIYFIGDDFKNDYLMPRELGLKGVLLDRFNRHPEVTDRVKDFYELIDYLSF